MLKDVLKSILNTMRYFLSQNNSKLFENLAEKRLLPEQVDGYVKKYDDPIVKEFLQYNLVNIDKLVKPNDVVLDIGCGSGRYLKALQEKIPKIQLYGIDISANTINNYTKNIVEAELEIGDFAVENPWEEDKFNLIYSITVLEYIPFFRLNKFLENIYNALKFGGKIYIQFPNGKNILELLKNLNYTHYPVDYVEKKLKQTGFKIMESRVDKNCFGAFIIAEK